MSRDWTRWAGVPIDAVGFGLLLLLCLAGAVLAGAAWRHFPAWLPRRSWLAAFGRAWRRLRRLRWSDVWRWRRRKRSTTVPAPDAALAASTDTLPDLPVEEFLSLADRHAAAGRYREAVRERLRAIARRLVDRRLITHHPEWTVTELANAAGAASPPLRGRLDEASGIFSDIWYGERPAARAHDERMRTLASEVDVMTAGSSPRPAPASVAPASPPGSGPRVGAAT